MKSHQKNHGGNERILTYMLREYPEPRDFASFVYLSQVQQAEAIKVGAEHLRRNRPRTMGALFWQLNDCWPVASWSSIDYFGRWKALQYYARRFYADLLLSPFAHDGTVDVYIVSDKLQPVAGQVRITPARLQRQDPARRDAGRANSGAIERRVCKPQEDRFARRAPIPTARSWFGAEGWRARRFRATRCSSTRCGTSSYR